MLETKYAVDKLRLCDDGGKSYQNRLQAWANADLQHQSQTLIGCTPWEQFGCAEFHWHAWGSLL